MTKGSQWQYKTSEAFSTLMSRHQEYVFLFSSLCKQQRKVLLVSIENRVCVLILTGAREIPSLSYSDLYKDSVQMVFHESKQCIINSRGNEMVEKHLWRSLNLSGLASWFGKQNSVKLIVILSDQWTLHICWLKTVWDSVTVQILFL